MVGNCDDGLGFVVPLMPVQPYGVRKYNYFVIYCLLKMTKIYILKR